MASPVFQYQDDTVPHFDSDAIMHHVRLVNPVLALKLEDDFGDPENAEPDDLVHSIWVNDRLLYQTLQEVVESWQNVYHQANQISSALLRAYYHARITDERAKMVMIAYAEEEEKETPKKKKEKKRKRETKLRQSEEEFATKEMETELPIAKRIREVMEQDYGYNDAKAFFWKVEPWTDVINVKDYVHFVAKGQKKFALRELQDFHVWNYVYHCNGPWDAERLVEIMESKNILAYAIKRRRGPADKEVLHYKVVATEFLQT